METEKTMAPEQIRNVLMDRTLTNKQKAQMLGYKRTSLYVEGKRVSGFVKGGRTFRKVRNLISYHHTISKEHPHIQ